MATTERIEFDEAVANAFVERVVGDMAGTTTTFCCALGDRLGLFRALAEGPATSAELAERAGVQERYVREWARALTAAGYLAHDPGEDRFSLPRDHAPALVDEQSPFFMGGFLAAMGALTAVFEPLERAFRDGGGVPAGGYGPEFWHSLDRATGPFTEGLLVPEWLPMGRGLEERLQAGISIADVGCGGGRAAATIARAYPRCRVTAIDIHPPNVERATTRVREAGVADRVTVVQADAIEGVPGAHDLILLLDVVHDSRDPAGLLRACRDALRPGGVALILEINCHERLEDDAGPLGALLYGISLLHCMPQSLAVGGAGLGTCGLPEPRLRELARQAGFASLERVAEEAMDVLYAARA